MEWKEDAIKAGVLATLGLVGHWTLKQAKSAYSSVRKVITDSEKIEEINRKVDYNYQFMMSIVHISRYPMYILDCATGGMIYANPAWCELLGYNDPEDAYGIGWMRAIPDNDSEKVMEENDRFVRLPSNFEGVVRFRHIKTGAEIICKCRSELLWENGKAVKAMGILEVISQS